MPLASTANLVLVGITDNQQALLKPAPGLPLPPSSVSALKHPTEVSTSVTITDNDPTLSPKADTLLRVDSCHLITTSIEVDAPPRRVLTPPIVPLSPAIVPRKVYFAPPHQKQCSLPTTIAQAFKGHNIVGPSTLNPGGPCLPQKHRTPDERRKKSCPCFH
jgi:hypothetical protein